MFNHFNLAKTVYVQADMVLTAMYKHLFRWKGSISKDLDLLCSGISGDSGDCYYGQV